MVTVKIVGFEKIEIDAEDGATVRDLVGMIRRKYPNALDRVTDLKTKQFYSYVNVWLNDQSIKTLENFETKLKKKDILMIFLPSAGG